MAGREGGREGGGGGHTPVWWYLGAGGERGWEVAAHPWSCLASLHCCNSSICVSETIFSVPQRTWQVWGPALRVQAPPLLLCTQVVHFFRLSSLALKSCSCVSEQSGCPCKLVPKSASNYFFFSFITLH